MQCHFFNMLTIKDIIFERILKMDEYVNTFMKRCSDWVLARPSAKHITRLWAQVRGWTFYSMIPSFRAWCEGTGMGIQRSFSGLYMSR
jgi:hypothetical protein